MTAAVAALLAALVVVLSVDRPDLVWRYAAAWVLFAAAVWLVRKVPVRQAVALVVAGGIAVAATGLAAPPRTSTDSYRYAWDGRVQAAGISPYDHPPADPALAGLRDGWLFPRAADCYRAGFFRLPEPGACTRINRSRVHTIYPPLAEVYFLAVHLVSPAGARHKPFQVGGLLLAVATTLALLLVLRGRGDPRLAAYWAWCPAVPVEAVNNAHVDVLAVLLTVAGLGVVIRHRAAGGALLGAAIAAKLLPAVVLPGALGGVRRVRDAAAVLLPAAAVAGLLYTFYALVSHASVFGYLTGYVAEEGYGDAASGDRFALLRWVLPDSWALPAAVLIVLAVVAYVLVNGDGARPWSGALLVTGTTFLVMTPGYSWYALLVVALVALDGRWEWLGVVLAGATAYLVSPAATAAYALAAAAVVGGWAVRRGGISRAAAGGRRWRTPRIRQGRRSGSAGR